MQTVNQVQQPTLLNTLPDDAHYQALGLVPGKFLASDNNKLKGTFLIDGEHFLEANLIPRRDFIKSAGIDPNQNYNWLCYPRTDMKGNLTKLLLLKAFPETTNTEVLNYFNIRGKVVKQDNGILVVKIIQQGTHLKFNIIIDGYMPSNTWGQFWDFRCYREGKNLLLEDAQLIFNPKKQRNKETEAQKQL